MGLAEYTRLVRERWMIIVAGLLVGLVIGGLVATLSPPQYSAKSTVYVSSQAPAADATAAYEGSLLSAQRIKSYTELLKGKRVTTQVIQQLGLQTTPDDLSKRITAFAEPDTVLLSATVSDTSSDRAVQTANAVTAAFTQLVGEIEQSTDPRRPPAVAAKVVEPATGAALTSFPPVLTLALAAALGLLAGFGAAVIRHKMDTSIKSPEQLRDALEVPGLGTIAYDRDVPERPLTVYQDPHSPRAEAFRQLRTNMQFVDIDGRQKVFTITSSVPGEGKTTTLCNLAIALADGGSRVLTIEADLRRPAAADFFDIDRAVGLTNVLAGRVPYARAIKSWRGNVLDVLPSGAIPPNPSELLASQQMAQLIEQLRSRYDYILLDTPPLLLVTDAAAVAPRTDGVVLVCRYGKTTRNQILASARSIEAVGSPLLGTVLTMAPKGPSRRAYESYYSYYTGIVTMDRQPPIRPAGNRAPTPAGTNGEPQSWPPSPVPRGAGEYRPPDMAAGQVRQGPRGPGPGDPGRG